MTAHAPDQNAATIRRMQHLVHLLAATIAEGDCDWSETVAALSYTLATVLDGQPDDDMRLRLGRQFAGRLERAAGETETILCGAGQCGGRASRPCAPTLSGLISSRITRERRSLRRKWPGAKRELSGVNDKGVDIYGLEPISSTHGSRASQG